MPTANEASKSGKYYEAGPGVLHRNTWFRGLITKKHVEQRDVGR